MTRPLLLAFAPFVTCLAFDARADTYEVGPGRSYPDIRSVAASVRPGDVVEVRGGATYSGDVVFRSSGDASAPIVLRGIRVAGARPVIAGGRTTLELRGDHIVLEGFELTAGSARCLYLHGADLTVRDVLVRDCPAHGILGSDDDSGSITLEYVEVRACGANDSRHSIYVATDERAHSGATFTMRHCYVHDGRGGNEIKSRAERNRIYENWIEGAVYHELELVGPEGSDPSLAREDSDVVGNVFVKTHGAYVTRFGGDGSGETFGRYRFVNNTVVVTPETHAVFRLFEGIESLEAHNNVFVRAGGGPVVLVRDLEAKWATGAPIVVGSNNWVPVGSSIPKTWTSTRTGDEPGFEEAASFAPRAGSPLIDAGRDGPRGAIGHELPWALAAPEYFPPVHAIDPLGQARVRARVGTIDIGAFEFGSPPSAQLVVASLGRSDAPPPLSPASPELPPPPKPPEAVTGCGCHGLAQRRDSHGPALAIAIAVAGLRRRKRRGVVGVARPCRPTDVSAPPFQC